MRMPARTQLASQPALSFTISTSVTNEVSEINNDWTNTNTNTVEKKPEIEWVRLKDGRIGNVLQHNGDWLVVRESGMRRSFKVNVLDCEYIHYKGENAPLLESKN